MTIKTKDGHELPEGLYVVTTAAPGPGAAALVAEALPESLEMNALARRAAIKAAGNGCEFVELENRVGQGFGTDSGAVWRQREDGLWCLGPFAQAPAITLAELDALCAGHLLGVEQSVDALAAGEGYLVEQDFARDLVALIKRRRAEGDPNAPATRNAATLGRILGMDVPS
jgi:hypothetical protein